MKSKEPGGDTEESVAVAVDLKLLSAISSVPAIAFVIVVFLLVAMVPFPVAMVIFSALMTLCPLAAQLHPDL